MYEPDIAGMRQNYANVLAQQQQKALRGVQDIYAGRGVTGSGEEATAMGEMGSQFGNAAGMAENQLQQFMGNLGMQGAQLNQQNEQFGKNFGLMEDVANKMNIREGVGGLSDLWSLFNSGGGNNGGGGGGTGGFDINNGIAGGGGFDINGIRKAMASRNGRSMSDINPGSGNSFGDAMSAMPAAGGAVAGLEGLAGAAMPLGVGAYMVNGISDFLRPKDAYNWNGKGYSDPNQMYKDMLGYNGATQADVDQVRAINEKFRRGVMI